MFLSSIYIVDKTIFITCFFVLSLFFGLAQAWIETFDQLIIAKSTRDEDKHFSFSLRYTMLNVGSCLGPVVARLLGLLRSLQVFTLSALVIFVYWVVLFITKCQLKYKNTRVNPWQNIMYIFKKPKFGYMLLTSTLVFISYTQIEVSFAYVAHVITKSDIVFVIMFAINTIMVFTLQIPVSVKLKRYDLHWLIFYGVLCIISGVALVAFAQHPWQFYLAMVLITLGEILSIPQFSLYIDVYFPQSKDVLFGLLNLRMLGRLLGAILATTLLSYFNIKVALLSCALMTAFGMITILLAKLIKGEKRPTLVY